MNRILSSRIAKAWLFLLGLVPLALLGYRFYANDLSANPVEFIEHYTGDWAILDAPGATGPGRRLAPFNTPWGTTGAS